MLERMCNPSLIKVPLVNLLLHMQLYLHSIYAKMHFIKLLLCFDWSLAVMAVIHINIIASECIILYVLTYKQHVHSKRIHNRIITLHIENAGRQVTSIRFFDKSVMRKHKIRINYDFEIVIMRQCRCLNIYCL